jgi:hypothetical protein
MSSAPNTARMTPWPSFEASDKARAIAHRWVDDLDRDSELREMFAREVHAQAEWHYTEIVRDGGKLRRVITSR